MGVFNIVKGFWKLLVIICERNELRNYSIYKMVFQPREVTWVPNKFL